MSLKNGDTKSCGCYQKVASSAAHTIYGETNQNRTVEYTAYMDAKARCFNPKHRKYKHYGGRGITMCNGWRYSYPNFLKDMGRRPDGLTIDRINNDGNYSCGKCQHCLDNGWPMNCRWATYKQQANNQRHPRIKKI